MYQERRLVRDSLQVPLLLRFINGSLVLHHLACDDCLLLLEARLLKDLVDPECALVLEESVEHGVLLLSRGWPLRLWLLNLILMGLFL
jgi:hypothetical protein